MRSAPGSLSGGTAPCTRSAIPTESSSGAGYLNLMEGESATQSNIWRPFGSPPAHRPLRKYNVDLYLAGHAHNYYRTLPYGFTGPNTTRAFVDPPGLTAIVAGGPGCDEMTYSTEDNFPVDPVLGTVAFSTRRFAWFLQGWSRHLLARNTTIPPPPPSLTAQLFCGIIAGP